MHVILEYWPIAMFMLVQSIGFVWKLSALVNRVRQIETQLTEYKKTNERLAALEVGVTNINNNLSRLESHILRNAHVGRK